MNKEEIYMEYKPFADDFVLHCLSIFHPQPQIVPNWVLIIMKMKKICHQS